MGMDEFVLGCLFRYLYPVMFFGHMDRLENTLDVINKIELVIEEIKMKIEELKVKQIQKQDQ